MARETLRLAPVSSLVASTPTSWEDVVRSAISLLSKGAQELSISVKGQEVSDGIEDYWALRLTGCQLAAVSEGARERALAPLEALGFFDEVSGGWPRVYGGVLELVLRDRPSPLVMIKEVKGVRIWAKLEWYNPLSLSIKDRTAVGLVEPVAEEVRRAGAVYEASSSNTAVALAALSRVLGFRVRAYIPATAEPFGEQMVRLLGGDVVRAGTSTTELRPIVKADAERDGAIVLNQFESYLNPLAHIRWTAKEIDHQSRVGGLRPRAVYVTMGTRGHAAGVSTYFRLRRPDVEVVGVQPSGGSSIPGLRKETSWTWGLLPPPTRVVEVSDEEAVQAGLSIARETGLLFGPSGGAAAWAAMRDADKNKEEGDYVIVVPDHGVKYLRLYLESLGA